MKTKGKLGTKHKVIKKQVKKKKVKKDESKRNNVQ